MPLAYLFGWRPVLILATGILIASTTGAAEPGRVVEQTVAFTYDRTDPYDRSNSFGFNHGPSVVHLGAERVMAAWFSGPYEASVHQLILAAVSEDGGRTWGDATVFHDQPRFSDFDPCFIQANDSVMAFFSTGRWTRYPFLGIGPEAKRQVGVTSFQIYTRRTSDGGRTWTQPQPPLVAPGWNCRSNGIQLRTGELILPTYLLGSHRSAVLCSADGGAAWVRSAEVVTPQGVGAAEPSVAQCADGSLLMVVRSRDGKLWTARSRDNGRNWSEPQATDLPAAASSHNLICTSKGRLVLTHNPTNPPLRTRLTLRVSDDNGSSWSTPLLVARVPAASDGEEIYSRQVSYPSVCELPGGMLLVVWTRIELSPTRQQGIIHAARVALN